MDSRRDILNSSHSKAIFSRDRLLWQHFEKDGQQIRVVQIAAAQVILGHVLLEHESVLVEEVLARLVVPASIR